MAYLDFVAPIVDDYDRAIDFFVRVLRFEMIEDVSSTTASAASASERGLESH